MGPAPAGVQQLQELMQRIINLSVPAAFIALTIMLLVIGIKYLVSGGEPKSLQSAHTGLTWALLGIVFLALAWLILLLVKAFTGADVTNFCLGFDCLTNPK